MDVQVGGRNFFPPMLRDIDSASSSVHINQFGFRPGTIAMNISSITNVPMLAGRKPFSATPAA